MKIWKVLAIAAAAAAVIPYRVEQDIETGEKTWDALLWQYKSRVDGDGEEQKELTVFPCRRPRRKAAEEAEMFADVDTFCCPDTIPFIEETDEPGPF